MDAAPLAGHGDAMTLNLSKPGGTMTKALYTAEARVTGGRQHGHGRTTDGELDVQLRPPKALGGEGGGTNPEQLFAIGYAACFEAAMLLAAQRLKVAVDQVGDAAIDSKVMLVPTGERALELGVELAVELPSVEDPRQAAEIVRIAHTICPYSNATRGNIDVAITVNGVALEREAVSLSRPVLPLGT
jgi:osmotically inducible protein OsmC